MATGVKVNVHTYATTHVATNLVRSLKDLVVACGLSAEKIVGVWDVLEGGVATWLGTRHLKRLILEIYPTATGNLVKRFDFDIDYSYHPGGGADLWIDPDTVSYAIRKAGTVPAMCSYDISAQTAAGRPDVPGWSTGTLRSTSGLTKRSVGGTVGGDNLGASLNYWR